MLTIGEHKNSLGRASEVVDIVLNDHSRLDELFECIFDDDAWVRMRAIDSVEKVCRVNPDWLQPYVSRLLNEVAPIKQASIQWHLAELFGKVALTPTERQRAVNIMKQNINSSDADWIVASNTIKTLTDFAVQGYVPKNDIMQLLRIQQTHHSPAVVKRATKFLDIVSIIISDQ